MTADRRLDRLVMFDKRSEKFPLTASLKTGKKPKSYTWRCGLYLDQGVEGSCTGCGITHELAARPVEVKRLHIGYAKRLYLAAQTIDEWPGMEPDYYGTTVLAAVKVAHHLGWFDSYRWAFGLDDLIMGVGHSGPAVLGLKWFEGMQNPGARSFISPTGRLVGGHCILCNGVDVKKECFRLHNSWGVDWGKKGECFITFADMKKLLKDEGEAVFFEGRQSRPNKSLLKEYNI